MPEGATPSEVGLWEGQGWGTDAYQYFPALQRGKILQMDLGTSQSHYQLERREADRSLELIGQLD